MSDVESPHAGGASAAAISNAAVRILRDYTGRGPTKARTTINSDMVVIVMGNTLIPAERSLVLAGESETVLTLRHKFQLTMQADLTSAVEEALARKVVAFMSANHIDPDLAVEVFVLAPEGSDGAGGRDGNRSGSEASAAGQAA